MGDAMTISVNLGADIEARLSNLAAATGRTKTFYLRQLVEQHLEDMEDIYLAEQALERIRNGEKTVPLEQVLKDLGMED